MYIEPTTTYYRGTQQCSQAARFLILIQERDKPLDAENLYAVVRHVALRQLGHFMMGFARIGKERISISGAYGHDGLPITMDKPPKDAVKVPHWLYKLWNEGGGHNGAGNEADMMRRWARAALPPKL